MSNKYTTQPSSSIVGKYHCLQGWGEKYDFVVVKMFVVIKFARTRNGFSSVTGYLPCDKIQFFDLLSRASIHPECFSST
jgi:hypothetical protein